MINDNKDLINILISNNVGISQLDINLNTLDFQKKVIKVIKQAIASKNEDLKITNSITKKQYLRSEIANLENVLREI